MKKLLWVAVVAFAVVGWTHLRENGGGLKSAMAQPITSAHTNTGRPTGTARLTRASAPITTARPNGAAPRTNAAAAITAAQPLDAGGLTSASFRATHAQVQGFLIHNWSQVNSQFEATESLKKLGGRIWQEFHIQAEKSLTRKNQSEHFFEEYGRKDRNTIVSMMLSSLRGGNGENQTIAIVRIQSTTPDLSAYAQDVAELSRIVTDSRLKPQISACIEGFVSARLIGVQADKLVSSAYSAVHASPTEGVQSDLVTSVSGYTPLGSTFILSNSRKLNLQVATHYDAYHHRTNVVVGTPIIITTY